MAKMHVAIIGSGCSGLAAIKACLDEGVNPVCFESSEDIGGLWRFSQDVTDGHGSVASSTVVNTSKEMMAYSDFPPPKEFPNFMHHTKLMEYFRLYADRFSLRSHIRFNTHVEHIQPNHENNNTLNTRPVDNVKPATDIHHDSGKCPIKRVTRHGNDVSIEQNKKEKTDNDGICGTTSDKTPDVNCNYDSVLNRNIDTESARDLMSENCFDSRKTWMIRVRNKSTGQTHVLYFDGVLVCTGHHAYINMPVIQGQSDFQGKLVHSRDVREASLLAGSRHVVVGVGNSGCDMAVEISRKSKVFLSTRRGTWLMHRLQGKGLPADIAYSNRLVFATAFSLPTRILNYLSARHLNQKIDHDLYGLRPRHGPVAAHPTVNDELPNRIACGQVVVKPNVQRLLKNGICFEDGTVEKDIDTVIMATGYHITFPFLDESIISNTSNDIPLYLYMFPTSETTHSLAIIGCVQPGGALAPVSEMQCRLAVKVFKGETALPSQESMERDMEKRRRNLENRYVHSPRHTIQVDYIPYMDQLASMIGCKPKLGKMIITDPVLASRCILGPCTAYQYRLNGPNSWVNAREAIMTQIDRVNFPLMTRRCEKETADSLKFVFISTMLICIIASFFYLILRQLF